MTPEVSLSPKRRTYPLILAFRSLGRYTPHYFGSVLCQFVSYLTYGVGFAWAIRLFTEAVLTGGRNRIASATLVMLGNGLVMSLAVFIGIYLNFISTAKVTQNLCAKVVRKALSAPLAYYDEHAVGETMNSMLNDVWTANNTFGELIEISGNAFLAVSATVTLLAWGRQVSLILLGAGLVCGFLGLAFLAPVRKAASEHQEQRARVTAFAMSIFSGVTVLKSLLAESAMFLRFKERSDLQKDLAKRESTAGLLADAVPYSVAEFAGVGILAVNGWLVLSGRMDVARCIALWQLSTQSITAFIRVPVRWVGLQPGFVAWERLRDALEMPEEQGAAPSGETVCETGEGVPETGKIEFSDGVPAIESDGVSFSYGPHAPVLSAINFTVREGERVALVGPSGSGKTTLFKLLLRLYRPDSGHIRLRGKDIGSIPLEELRQQIAFVPQEPWIFPGTVLENIALGRPGASRSEIVRAATLANAHEFISALPQGYDTLLTERGGNLSGGERQRICLARAFLKDAPVLLLDEPTSSVDSESERLIADALNRLCVGRTVITISHTGRILKGCDLVLRLDGGQIRSENLHA